jgi:16S rRNA (cytosine1402-N4)-methyltransferase
MVRECVEALVWDPHGVYVDGTLGGGGHSLAICQRLEELATAEAANARGGGGGAPTGKCLSLDRDPEALATASQRLATHLASGRWACAAADFRTLDAVLRLPSPGGTVGGGALGHLAPADGLGVHGLLLDLGVSSHQLDDRKRGFSFRDDGPLDMRMSQQALPTPTTLRSLLTGGGGGEEEGEKEEDGEGEEVPGGAEDGGGLTAATIVNTWPPAALERVLRDYGEEPRAHKMALRIADARPVAGTAHLVDLVRSCLPPGPPKDKRKALTRVFQALRIAVNDEVAALEAVLAAAAKVVRPGGKKLPLPNTGAR